eukprot:c7053_g1_i1.p1 GENE.c7053_g1_i1~~c7053_g1_i1.p1  ORF type:complete len:369 (-),score=106.36 c7053_g1_i1:30-1094(-)
MTEAQSNEWTIRAVTPTGNKELKFSNGPEATLDDLVKECAQVTRMPQKRLQIKCGYPRELIVPRPQPLNTVTLKDVALSNKASIFIELATDDTGPSHSSSSAAHKSTAAAPPPKPPVARAPKKRKITGQGTRLGTQKNALPPLPLPPLETDNLPTTTTTTTTTTSTSANSGNTQPTPPALDAREQIAVNLAAAVSSVQTSDPNLNNVLKTLRKSLQEARRQIGDEQEALAKVTGALSGKTKFEELPDGTSRMKVTYQVGRKESTECVQDIPPILLTAIISQWVTDESPAAKMNLVPQSMALVSPRLFWSVVRHGGVGPEVSFNMALRKLVPAHLEDKIDKAGRRQTKRPLKYSA